MNKWLNFPDDWRDSIERGTNLRGTAKQYLAMLATSVLESKSHDGEELNDLLDLQEDDDEILRDDENEPAEVVAEPKDVKRTEGPKRKGKGTRGISVKSAKKGKKKVTKGTKGSMQDFVDDTVQSPVTVTHSAPRHATYWYLTLPPASSRPGPNGRCRTRSHDPKRAPKEAETACLDADAVFSA